MGEYVIKLPDVGEGVAEAELVEWHVKTGDLVREDQVLAAVMTDKATVEIPSPVEGEVTWVGVEIGDTVEASIDLDSAEREITVPDDLAAALDADGLRAAFDALAPSRRKEIVRGVTEAKQAATRERRIAAAVDSLG